MPFTTLTLLLLAAAEAPAPVTRLTQVIDAYPMLSPDGRTLLFQSNRHGRWALYTAASDGSAVKLLLDSGDDPVVAAWSPDGRQIAFAATVDGQSEIFVMNADASGRQRLSNDPGDDSHPHWSADGRIFFNSARTTPDRSAEWPQQWHEIFSMRADGTDVRQHTRCRAVCTFGSASPDGTRIVYRKVIPTPGFDWSLGSIPRNSEVFVADLDGGNERNVSSNAAFDGWPLWSPDGAWIAFASNRSGPAGVGQVWIAKPDGSELRRISDGASHVQPSWSPDGRAVLASRVWEGEGYEHGHVVRYELRQPAAPNQP
jgi:Tol biopolymer transport system component